MPARVALKYATKLGKCLLLGAFSTSLWLLSPTLSGPERLGTAHAQGRGHDEVEKVIKLRILGSKGEKPAPKVAQGTPEDKFETKKIAEITQLTARSIRTRLKAAGVRDFSVTSTKSRTILVRVRGNIEREVIAGIVVPSGRLELRPVQPAGANWVRALADLPAGVELRQEKESLDAAHAYLWSADAETLRAALAVLEKTSVKNVNPIDGALKFNLYPADGGWRALALSAPIATHQDVASASISQGKTGEPFVQVIFQNNLSDAIRTNSTLSEDATSWAVLLDGEVVSLLNSRGHNLGSSLSIKAPAQLRTRQARQAWAKQVAGRLAAYIPVPLIEDSQIAPLKK